MESAILPAWRSTVFEYAYCEAGTGPARTCRSTGHEPMHELSVCMSLMEQLESIARERNAASIVRVELRIGVLSGVEPDLLENAWPIAAAGTIADEAELRIETGQLIVECSSCGARSDATPNRLLCGDCGDNRTRIVTGDELLLLRVELETFATEDS